MCHCICVFTTVRNYLPSNHFGGMQALNSFRQVRRHAKSIAYQISYGQQLPFPQRSAVLSAILPKQSIYPSTTILPPTSLSYFALTSTELRALRPRWVMSGFADELCVTDALSAFRRVMWNFALALRHVGCRRSTIKCFSVYVTGGSPLINAKW